MKDVLIEVLNFGSLNVDHVYNVPHFVRPGETLSGSGYASYAGGKGLNQSVALARAGVRVSHAGKIGSDGMFLKKTLQEAGVNTDFVFCGDTPTGHAVIQIDPSGQNSILLYPGANCEITGDEMSAVLESLPPGAWLLLQNEINSIPFLMSKAKECGLRIAINPAPCSAEVKKYPLHLADILFVNEIEAAELAGINGRDKEILAALTSRYPDSEVIMTLGGDGAMYGKKDIMFHTPPTGTDVVDTTSAGDTFNGYYLAARLRGFPPERAMASASKAAGIAVSRHGAAVSIPAAPEVFS